MRRRRLAIALYAACSLSLGAATAHAQGGGDDDWGVHRDQFDKNVVARYKGILAKDPADSGALSKLVSLYRSYRTIGQLVGEYEKAVEKDGNDFAALAILGHLQLQEGAPDKALGYYERAAALKPKDPSVQVALGGLYQRNGKNEQAKAAYDAALAGKPSDATKIKVLRALADLALGANDIDGARAYYEQYFAVDPKNIQARVELGDALFQHGKHAEAIAVYTEAEKKLGSDPTRKVEVVARMGRAHEGAGEDDAALREYRRAIGMVSRGYYLVEELTVRIVDVYRRRQDLAGLLTQLEKDWPAKSRQHFEWSQLGRLYEETGNQEKAIEAFQKAVQKAPYELDTQHRLITLLVNAGREAEALAQYETVVKVAPGEPRFQSELAEKYWERGDQKKALALLKKMEDRFPGDAGVHVTVADLYTRWGKEELALAAYERLTVIEPDDASHLVTLGEQYFQRGDKDKAISIWKKIASSGKAEGLAKLGETYAEHDMLPDALAVYAKAIKLQPKDHDLFIGRAAVLERQKAYVDAIADWERALALLTDKPSDRGVRREGRRRIVNLLIRAGSSKESEYRTRWLTAFRATPPDLEAGYFLVELYGRRPQSNEPRLTLEKILKIKPDDLEAMDELVKTYRGHAQYEDAIALLEKMITLAPTREREFYNQIAEIKTAQKKDDEAIFYAQKALEKNPNDPVAHERIAERYADMQRFDDAIASYEKSLKLDATNFKVHFALAQLYIQTDHPDRAAALYRKVLAQATDDEILTRAGKEAIDLEEITGTLGELEKAVSPLIFTFAHKDIYRRILVDLYRRYVPTLTARAASGDAATRQAVRTELDRLGTHGLSPLLLALRDQTDPTQQAIAVEVLGHLGNKGAAAALVQLARQEPAADPAGARRIGTLTASVDWKVRVAALVAAGRLGDVRVIDQVLPLVEHDEVSVREAAVFTLGRTGDKKAVPALYTALTDRRESVQVLACLGLGQSHDGKTVARLSEIVGDSRRHDLTRGACAFALGALGASSAVSALSDAVVDGGGETQRLAAWALGRLGDKKALPALLQAYFSRNEAVRASALAALAQLAGGSTATAPVSFGDYPMDDDKYDAPSGVRALGGGDPPAVSADLVGTVLTGHEHDVELGLREALSAYRDMALRVLLDLDGRARADRIGLGPLTAALDGRGGNAAAEKALATIGKAIRPDVEALLGHADAKVRALALAVLARIGASAGIADAVEPSLVKGLTDKVSMVRGAAARATVIARAGATPSKAVVEALQGLLASEIWRDRAVAAESLGALGADTAAAALIKALADDSEFVREATARALGVLRATAGVSGLLEVSEDESAGVRRAAATALLAIGDRRAKSRLAAMASGDPDESVRAAAAGSSSGTKK